MHHFQKHDHSRCFVVLSMTSAPTSGCLCLLLDRQHPFGLLQRQSAVVFLDSIALQPAVGCMLGVYQTQRQSIDRQTSTEHLHEICLKPVSANQLNTKYHPREPLLHHGRFVDLNGSE
ncbi:hypothetical protein GY45DRAFT_1321046 [Cubamyces sp. BRFM 1775]|nr:hypothetical protein GY45DRAFT_1321046 [Cubamyces sp. BRFM 1775]